MESRPNPGRRYYRRNSHYHQPRSYSSGSRGPNQFLKGQVKMLYSNGIITASN